MPEPQVQPPPPFSSSFSSSSWIWLLHRKDPQRPCHPRIPARTKTDTETQDTENENDFLKCNQDFRGVSETLQGTDCSFGGGAGFTKTGGSS